MRCLARRCRLPLRFCRQAATGPARIGVGLVETDVTYGRAGFDRLPAGQREVSSEFDIPIERSIDPFRFDPRPTVRQPEGRMAVSTVGDESPIFVIRDRTTRDREVVQQHFVAGCLVVERESIAFMTELCDTAAEVDESHCRRRGTHDAVSGLDECRTERIDRKDMLDVREHQFLVLLLVIEAEFRQRAEIDVFRLLLEQR